MLRSHSLIVAAAVSVASHRGARAQTRDAVTQAALGLKEFSEICARPASMIWAASLCGRMVLIDPDTRAAVTNQQPRGGNFVATDGVFRGTLPEDVMIANTAVPWNGDLWTMIMLPLSSDAFARIRLFAHESFHRIQDSLGVPIGNVVIPQLDERDARYWLRLELRALSDVQKPDEASSRAAARDALLFRAVRHASFPGIDTLEIALERSEGLAEYTGTVVAARARGMSALDAVERSRVSFERLPTFVRSYGYGAGPPLGMALDRFVPDWRRRIRTITSMSAELGRATAWSPPPNLLDSARQSARRYDEQRIAAEEDRRAADRAASQLAYRKRLVDGPVVVFRQQGLAGGFDPNTIIPLGEIGLIYPRRTVSAEWGQLTVASGGMLVSTDRQTVRVSAVGVTANPSAQIVRGDGWELTLAAGWTLVPGSRDGDFQVARVKSP
jgi:hypothetical protein